LVMDWTTIGASEPIRTDPIRMVLVFLLRSEASSISWALSSLPLEIL